MSNPVTMICRPVRASPAQKAVLMCLADYCHHDGRDWHSIDAIMVWTCLGRRTVIDALQALEARGLILIERTRGQRNRTGLQIDRIKAQAQADDLAYRCGSRTGAAAAPVREPHDTSAAAAPPPVQQPHPKHQEASEKHQEAKTRGRVETLEVMPDDELPEWLPVAAWRCYVEARAGMRKPMGLNAQKIAIKRLAKFRSGGHDVEAILETSVMNDWQGLFAPDQARPAPASTSSETKPAWALAAGFSNRFDAENEGCNERNAELFRDGKRLRPVAGATA
jgi:hypothetical protein